MLGAGGTKGVGRRRVLTTALIATMAMVAGLLPVTPAAAHGDVDQGTGPVNEPCSTAAYPGSKLVTSGESRQTFVPVLPGLTGVELCLQNLVGVAGTDFTVKIYREGDGATADQLIATEAHDAGTSLLAAQWVHVDFDDIVSTTPGTSYVLGVTPAGGAGSSVSFQWRSTCDGLLASCDLLYTDDVYPQGETNDLPGNADYGFRTRAPSISDLVSTASVDAAICPGLDLAGRATGTVRNAGADDVGAFSTQWLWSTDNVRSAGDRLLGAAHAVPGLAGGASVSIPAPTLPGDLPFGPGYLLLAADVGNTVRENDDANNIAAPSSTVTACAQPNLATLDLSVTETSVTTGFHEVQFADLPASVLSSLPQTPAEITGSPAFQPNGYSPNGYSPNGYSPNGYSNNGFSPNGYSPNGYSPNGYSPNGYSPNGYSPNGYSPNGYSAAGAVLLAAVLDDLPPSIARSSHVVDIPISGVGWEERLAGRITVPIQNVTLAEAVVLLPDLRLDEVDLSRVLTSSWLALALANAPLASVPIDWCALLAANGSTCAGLGIDPATTSLLGLEGAGFPSHLAPIAGRSIAAQPVDNRWLALSLPLSGERSFHLGMTDLGQLPADQALTSPSTIVDCGAFTCSLPLAEAQAAGAIRNVTVQALVSALSPLGRQTMTLGDLAMGTASLHDLRLSAANWNRAHVPDLEPACPAVQYRLTGTNTGSGAAIDPVVTVTLPAGFAYLPRSVALVDDGAAGGDQPEPSSTVTTAGVRTYTFGLDAHISSSFTLTFQACANQYLGAFAVGSASIEGVGITGPYGRSTVSTDEVVVTERTPGLTTQAVVNGDNVVIADHIATAGDYDTWTFPVKPEPGTLYVVKLFPPAGVDYDLLAFGPPSSSLAFNPNGYSPNGYSPNGYSTNAFSPNAYSPNGYSGDGFAPNGYSPNGYSPNGYSSTSAPDLNDDVPIEELQPPGSTGVALSANRGDTVETLHLVGRPGDAGNLTLSVADYNGSRSWAPYFLTIQTIRPTVNPALATCQTTPWDLAETPGPAPATWTGTSPPKTLFVTNAQVHASLYDTTETNAGFAALRDVAARPEVRGIVLNVDSDADVRAAYAGWRSKWCDPTAANVVATQIRRLVLAQRQKYPTIDTIVLAGGDSVLPDFRLDDRSAMANEDQYTEALLRASRTNNPLVAAFANGYLPSADPYGNEGALPFGLTYAFPPSAGVSRLIERPSDWVLQRDQYVLSNGALDPAEAFISAYDGMVDGAEAAAGALRGADVPTTLLTDEQETWTAAQFAGGAFDERYQFGGWNGHANHFGLLSDDGSARDDGTEQITTADGGSIPEGTFVFSNGCHFGTAVDDLVNAAPTESERIRLRDWAQTITGRKGIAVANTGFGIFDTVEVGQGERLQQYFLEELPRSSNVALALAKAKNRFFAAPGVFDAYTYKTMHQLAVYGLGTFKMFGASADPTPEPRPPATSDRIELDTGSYAVDATGTSTCTRCYRLQSTPNGTRVELRDPAAEAGHTSAMGYWSAPMSIRKVRLPMGKVPAGLWINELRSTTLADQDLTLTRLAVEDPASEREPQNAGPFPTTISSVNTVGGTAHVSLLHGIAVPERKVEGKVAGDIHLYTSVKADLRLRDETTTGCAPTIASVTPTQLPGSPRVVIDINATETCGTTTRGAVLGRLSDGSWVYAEAAKSNGRWLTSISLPAGSTLEDLVVQVANAVDVGLWRFKGDRPVINQGRSDGVDLTFTGTLHASGIYKSAVTAKIVGTPGVTYEVFDKDKSLGRVANGATISISGDGPHEVSAFGSDGSAAGRVVAIDTTAPTITWVTPAVANASYGWGDPARLAVFCGDASGTSCVARIGGVVQPNGSPLTQKAGTYTVTVEATDAVGNPTTASRTFTVRPKYVISAFGSPIKAKPNLNVVSPNANLAIKFSVTADGVTQTDVGIIAGKYWQAISCSSKAPTSSTTFTTNGTTPQYTSEFHFNLMAPSPTGCYALYVELIDGTTQSAYFQVKR